LDARTGRAQTWKLSDRPVNIAVGDIDVGQTGVFGLGSRLSDKMRVELHESSREAQATLDHDEASAQP
jgi:hypothetical protein